MVGLNQLKQTIPNKQFEEVVTKGKGRIEILIPISKIINFFKRRKKK